MGIACRKALCVLAILTRHVSVLRNSKLIAGKLIDGKRSLADVIEYGNILKGRILLHGVCGNLHAGRPNGIPLIDQGKIQITALRLPEAVPVVLVIVLDQHRNVLLFDCMSVHQDIAVPLTAGKLLIVLFNYLVAVRNLIAGFCEVVIGQGIRNLEGVDPVVSFRDLDGIDLTVVCVPEGYLHAVRTNLFKVVLILPADRQCDGLVLLVVVIRDLKAGRCISPVLRGIIVDRCNGNAVVDLVSFLIYGHGAKIEIPGRNRVTGRFFNSEGFNYLSVFQKPHNHLIRPFLHGIRCLLVPGNDTLHIRHRGFMGIYGRKAFFGNRIALLHLVGKIDCL